MHALYTGGPASEVLRVLGVGYTSGTAKRIFTRFTTSTAGWQTLVDGMRRLLPRITAAGVLPPASQNGLRGRPTYQLGDVDNLYFAGDWIGPRGFLVDASLDSAREVARRILCTDPRRADQPSPEAVAAA